MCAVPAITAAITSITPLSFVNYTPTGYIYATNARHAANSKKSEDKKLEGELARSGAHLRHRGSGSGSLKR
jgi:hypothetical protein